MKTQYAQEIVDVGKLLYERNLTYANGGNISVRCQDSILITPSGVCKGMLSFKDMIEIKIDTGEVVSTKKPSMETPFHLGLYRSRPEVNAVIHCHPLACTTLASTNRNLRTDLTPESLMVLGRNVPTVPYDTPGTEGLAEKLISVLGQNKACLMQNHGALVVGKSSMDAFYRMETLEYVARLQLNCGDAPGLSEEEIDKVLAMSK